MTYLEHTRFSKPVVFVKRVLIVSLIVFSLAGVLFSAGCVEHKQCTANKDCPEGQKCLKGECVNASFCSTPADCEGLASIHQCGGHWSCENNQCKWVCNVECNKDSDCASKECPPPTKLGCASNVEPLKKCEKGACVCECPPQSSLHEVHEWGVIAGCWDSNEAFVTSRPQQLVYVKQPVIYLHADNSTHVEVKVKFKNGTINDTYPNAEIRNNTILWDVLTKDGCKQHEASKRIPMEFVPLEEIKDQLNDVDASCVVYDNTENKFLFYEGEMVFENKVGLNFSNETATIKNNRNKPIYDAKFVVGVRDPEHVFSVRIKLANFGTVGPGEEKTVKLENLSIGKGELSKELVALGFTPSESEAFSNVWYESFFKPSNMPFQQLIYRLDQTEYDEMFPINVTPKPEKIVRAMYVLIK